MQIFKTKAFARWAKKEGVCDRLLLRAAHEMESGLMGVDMGHHIYKKRIPLPGRGKRGGARCVVAYATARTLFFLFGYAKNERADLSAVEMAAAKVMAVEVLAYTPLELQLLCREKQLIEVCDE